MGSLPHGSIPGAGTFSNNRPPWRGLNLPPRTSMLTVTTSSADIMPSVVSHLTSSCSAPNLPMRRNMVTSSSQARRPTRSTTVVRPKARRQAPQLSIMTTNNLSPAFSVGSLPSPKSAVSYTQMPSGASLAVMRPQHNRLSPQPSFPFGAVPPRSSRGSSNRTTPLTSPHMLPGSPALVFEQRQQQPLLGQQLVQPQLVQPLLMQPQLVQPQPQPMQLQLLQQQSSTQQQQQQAEFHMQPRSERSSPPQMHHDFEAAANSAVAELDAAVFREHEYEPPEPPPHRMPHQIIRRLASSDQWSSRALSELSEAGKSVTEQLVADSATPTPAEQRESKGHFSMWGELVTSAEDQAMKWQAEGYEVRPPPSGLILTATERLAQIAEAEAEIKSETAAKSEAVANAVSIAVAEKLLPFATKASAPVLEDDRCVEVEQTLSVTPDQRVHADQQGWRWTQEEEEATRGATYREWVATHTSRDFDLDLLADETQPDVVYGAWTCCDSLDPKAEGCMHGAHSDEMLRCVDCGRWVRQEHWDIERCWHHPGEIEQQRWGGLRWECCGKQGIKNSKYAKVGEHDAQVDVPNSIDRGMTWDKTLAPQKGKNRPAPLGKTAPIATRWAHLLASQTRACTLAEIKNRNGCTLGVHRHICQVSCSHCDAPLVLEPQIGNEPRHMRPLTVCLICGHENRICTQCNTVVPAIPILPPPEDPPPGRPPASYNSFYELPGAPFKPPDPPPRPSLFQAHVDGFDKPCQFHPGVWDPSRRTRLASGQTRTRPPPPPPPPPDTEPPAPTPPKSPLVSPPDSPPPTALLFVPREWVSRGFQTDERPGKPLGASTQTCWSKDESCQHEMPIGVSSQTEEIEPQWCSYTTRTDKSMSIVVRRWTTLPRDFIIPGDKYEGNNSANGKYGTQNKAFGSGPLRQVMEATRAKPASVHKFDERFQHTKYGKTVGEGFKTWSANVRNKQIVLAWLLPAAYRIAIARRWRHALAPDPPSSSLPAVFGVQGQIIRGLGSMTVFEQIEIIRWFNRWLINYALDSKAMRAQLTWVGTRMRYGELHVAFETWSERWLATRRAKNLPGLKHWADDVDLVPKIRRDEAIEAEAVKTDTVECGEQTDNAWEWLTEIELRGLVHWNRLKATTGMQTMPLARMREVKPQGTQVEYDQPIVLSTGAQTDENPVYGQLNLTRRTGTAAENKVDKYRDTCTDEKATKGMREAGVRLVKRLKEERTREAEKRKKAAEKDDRALATWAYTSMAPELDLKEKRRAESQSQVPSEYTINGRRSTRELLSLAKGNSTGSLKDKRQSSLSAASIVSMFTPNIAPSPQTAPTPDPIKAVLMPGVEAMENGDGEDMKEYVLDRISSWMAHLEAASPTLAGESEVDGHAEGEPAPWRFSPERQQQQACASVDSQLGEKDLVESSTNGARDEPSDLQASGVEEAAAVQASGISEDASSIGVAHTCLGSLGRLNQQSSEPGEQLFAPLTEQERERSSLQTIASVASLITSSLPVFSVGHYSDELAAAEGSSFLD